MSTAPTPPRSPTRCWPPASAATGTSVSRPPCPAPTPTAARGGATDPEARAHAPRALGLRRLSAVRARGAQPGARTGRRRRGTAARRARAARPPAGQGLPAPGRGRRAVLRGGPARPRGRRALQRLHDASPVPLAVGELFHDPAQFTALLGRPRHRLRPDPGAHPRRADPGPQDRRAVRAARRAAGPARPGRRQPGRPGRHARDGHLQPRLRGAGGRRLQAAGARGLPRHRHRGRRRPVPPETPGHGVDFDEAAAAGTPCPNRWPTTAGPCCATPMGACNARDRSDTQGPGRPRRLGGPLAGRDHRPVPALPRGPGLHGRDRRHPRRLRRRRTAGRHRPGRPVLDHGRDHAGAEPGPGRGGPGRHRLRRLARRRSSTPSAATSTTTC